MKKIIKSLLLMCLLVVLGSSIVYGSGNLDISHSTIEEDNTTSVYTLGQFLINVTVTDNVTINSYTANITKKNDSTLMWNFVNSSINQTTFNHQELIDVSSWENTTYVMDNTVCDDYSCLREIYEFEFKQPYYPVITVYEPTEYTLSKHSTELPVTFDIEVSDSNGEDVVSYSWKVDSSEVAITEDYSFNPTGVNTYSVVVDVYDNSQFNYSDSKTWSVSAYGFYDSYDKDDFKNIVVDGMGTAGASVVDWIDLFILLIVLGFIVGTFIKLGKIVRGR